MTANGMQAHRTGSYSRADIINTDTHCYEYLKVFNSLLQRTHLAAALTTGIADGPTIASNQNLEADFRRI